MRTAAACLAVCLAISSLLASGDAQPDLSDHARGAGKVVLGTVTQLDSAFGTNDYGDQVILSRLVIRVDETMKGKHEPTVEVTVEGGTVGDLTLEVSDMTRLERGARAVLFLNPSPKGGHAPHGRGAGVLELDADDRVRGTGITLDQIRDAVRAAGR